VNLLHQSLPWLPALLGWAILLPVLVLALRGAGRGFFGSGAVENAWFGGAVCVALLWRMAIHVGPGPAFGMLGAGLYVLVFGARRGMLGLVLALLLHTACTDGSWRNLGVNGLLLAALPAVLARSCQRLIEKRLPPQLFVFIIGNGMFTTLITAVVAGMAIFTVAALVDPAAGYRNLGQYLGPLLLLAWSEAIVSGMLFSALVIFQPGIVLTYRQDRYLPPRKTWMR